MDYEVHIRLLIERQRVQGELMEGLIEQVNNLSQKLELLWQATDQLRHRNEYGLTESEARMAHQLMYLARGQEPPSWKPWPMCHCQLDAGSQDVQSLYYKPSFGIDQEYEADL